MPENPSTVLAILTAVSRFNGGRIAAGNPILDTPVICAWAGCTEQEAKAARREVIASYMDRHYDVIEWRSINEAGWEMLEANEERGALPSTSTAPTSTPVTVKVARLVSDLVHINSTRAEEVSYSVVIYPSGLYFVAAYTASGEIGSRCNTLTDGAVPTEAILCEYSQSEMEYMIVNGQEA